MSAIPFRTVLEQVLGLTGLSIDLTNTANLDNAENAINGRVQEGWDWFAWPDLRQIEERAFADNWRATKAYAAGDVVYDTTTATYYTCALANTGEAVTDPTYWTAGTTPDVREIAWNQDAATKIGRVWKVWNKDPRSDATAVELDWVERGDGFTVREATAATVWVEFAKPAERYTTDVHSAAVTYSRYDRVFYPGTETELIFPDRGEVYEADLDTNDAQVWVLVPFPIVLSRFVAWGAAADMLRMVGRIEQAEAYEARARSYLLEEMDKVSSAQAAQVRVG